MKEVGEKWGFPESKLLFVSCCCSGEWQKRKGKLRKLSYFTSLFAMNSSKHCTGLYPLTIYTGRNLILQVAESVSVIFHSLIMQKCRSQISTHLILPHEMRLIFILLHFITYSKKGRHEHHWLM
ncbi:hypothetical protein VNO80_02650 [Phaseolus coccineus]|uniref:Uncharacterized protein n=1 Tax=Phaseolus coccineus TaxID=3886 RepID=A0AAN9NX73_PHACN